MATKDTPDKPVPVVGSLLASEKPYSSNVMADHGHDYQRELLLFFCLMLSNWDDYDGPWRIGLEVKDSSKFDDIVVEFEINGQGYTFHIQSKHASNEKKIVTWDHVLARGNEKKEREKGKGSKSPTEPMPSSSKENPQPAAEQPYSGDNLKASFSVNKYYEAWEKVTWTEDRLRKYIILTNHKFDLTTVSKDVPTVVDETDQIFKRAFENLEKSCGDAFKIIKLSGKVLVVGKELKMDKRFQDNFMYIVGLSNVQDLTMYNNSLLEQKYEGFTSKNFSRVRNNVFDTMKTDNDEEDNVIRRTMTEKKFDKIIQHSVLEVDIPTLSAGFCVQFNWLDFEGSQELNLDQKEYFCNGSAKLLSFMIYKQLVAKFEANGDQTRVFCVPFSKLTKIYRKSLKAFKHKVVVYVEERHFHDQNTQELQELQNCDSVILVFQSKDNDQAKVCSFEDLTTESRSELLKKTVKFQGFENKISDITTTPDVLTEILQELFVVEQVLEFGRELSMKKMPEQYIEVERKLKDINTAIDDDYVFAKCQNIIIDGPAGVGKSTTMMRIARNMKTRHPSYYVIFLDLKEYSEVLKEIKDQEDGTAGMKRPTLQDVNNRKKKTSKDSQDVKQEGKKPVDILEVFLQNILKLKTDENKLERLVFEDYMKQDEIKTIVFLDGFDEISPYYSKQVIEIAEVLKKKQIRIFISTQPHFVEDLKGLKFQKHLSVGPYEHSMQGEFLRCYWRNHLQKMISNKEVDENTIELSNVNVYTKKFMNMCYKSKLTENIRSIPLLLIIIADIFLEDCVKFCTKPNANWSEDFLHVSVLAIYDEIFQSICKKFYRKTEENPYNVHILDREPHIIEEVREIYLYIAAKRCFPDLCAKDTELKFRKNEILGRGFITEGSEGGLFFIHEAFKNYFAAQWFTRKLFPGDKIVDVDLLKSLRDGNKFDRNIKSYVCRFMMEHLDSEKFKEKKNAGNQTEEIQQISETLLKLFSYIWFSHEVNLVEATLEVVKELCKEEDIKRVFEEKKFFDNLSKFSSLQYLETAIKTQDEYYGSDATNKSLEKQEKYIINSIIKETNFVLFEYFFKTVTDERKIFEIKEYETRTYGYFRTYLMGDKKLSNWMFVQDMLLWFFERLNVTETDILTDVKNILSESKENFMKQRFLLGHYVAVFCEWKQNHDTFLPEVYKVVETRNDEDKEQNLYRFFHALNSITREDIFKKSIEVMRQNGYNFICHDRMSVLCHAFMHNNNYLMQVLLKLLTKDEVKAQIQDMVCGGISIVRKCTMGNQMCKIIKTYMLENFEDADFSERFPMYSGGHPYFAK